MTAGVSFLRDLSSCIRSLSAWKEASGKGWELLTGWGQAWQGSLIPGDGAQVPPTPGARDVGEAKRRQITEALIISEGEQTRWMEEIVGCGRDPGPPGAAPASSINHPGGDWKANSAAAGGAVRTRLGLYPCLSL